MQFSVQNAQFPGHLNILINFQVTAIDGKHFSKFLGYPDFPEHVRTPSIYFNLTCRCPLPEQEPAEAPSSSCSRGGCPPENCGPISRPGQNHPRFAHLLDTPEREVHLRKTWELQNKCPSKKTTTTIVLNDITLRANVEPRHNRTITCCLNHQNKSLT